MERAGGGVARVLEGLFVAELLLFHQLFKGGVGHVDLAPHFQIFRRVFQLFGNVRDGGEVRGHVLAHHAVAPGGAAHKAPVLVFQAHREAVDLDLHHIQRFEAFAPHPAVELPQFIKAEGILQAFHLDLMGHLGEPPGRRAAHFLGGRIRRDQLGILGFQGLEFPGQRVIFIVLQFGGVLLIIKAVVAFDHLAEIRAPLLCLFQFHVFHLCKSRPRAAGRLEPLYHNQADPST